MVHRSSVSPRPGQIGGERHGEGEVGTEEDMCVWQRQGHHLAYISRERRAPAGKRGKKGCADATINGYISRWETRLRDWKGLARFVAVAGREGAIPFNSNAAGGPPNHCWRHDQLMGPIADERFKHVSSLLLMMWQSGGSHRGRNGSKERNEG